jgi:hypothetical protein
VALKPPVVAPLGAAAVCEVAAGLEVDTDFEAAVVLGAGAGVELEADLERAAGVGAGADFDLETVFVLPVVFGVDPGL